MTYLDRRLLMRIDAIAIGGEPIKYGMDKAAGTLVVDRFLHTPMRYPGNYGFVPHTLSDDGDPIDVVSSTGHSQDTTMSGLMVERRKSFSRTSRSRLNEAMSSAKGSISASLC